VPLTRHEIHNHPFPGVLAKTARTPGYRLYAADAAFTPRPTILEMLTERPDTSCAEIELHDCQPLNLLSFHVEGRNERQSPLER